MRALTDTVERGLGVSAVLVPVAVLLGMGWCSLESGCRGSGSTDGSNHSGRRPLCAALR